jgi:hypothetical protein
MIETNPRAEIESGRTRGPARLSSYQITGYQITGYQITGYPITGRFGRR